MTIFKSTNLSNIGSELFRELFSIENKNVPQDHSVQSRLGTASNDFFKHSDKKLQDFASLGWCHINYNYQNKQNLEGKTSCRNYTNSKAVHRNELMDGLFAYYEANPSDLATQYSLKLLFTVPDSPGSGVPWLINDFSTTKGVDEKIRKKIDHAKKAIDQLLAKNNITAEKNPSEYQRLVAVLAFYFVLAPNSGQKNAKAFHTKYHQSFPKWYQSLVSQESDEKEKNLLLQFESYLKKQGGLGACLWNKEIYEEKSAAQVFKAVEDENNKNVSSCTKNHKVLYHVFQQMGLNPHFVLVKGPDHDVAVTKKTGQDTYTKNQIHICLKLKFSGNNSRLFDLTHIYTFQSRAKYTNYYELNLRQYASVDLMNQSNSELITHKEAITLLKEALFFDSHNPYAYHSLSYRYFQSAQREENKEARMAYLNKSKKAAEKAITLDNYYAPSYNRLGITLIKIAKEYDAKKDKEEIEKLKTLARKQFSQAIRLDHKLEIAKDKLTLLQSSDQ